MTYFIADLHFGHKNALAFDHREYQSIEEHDHALIDNWNAVVGIEDDVWILGDISWYGVQKTVEIFRSLNGTKHLCVGNHDRKLLRNRDVQALFAEITDYKELQLTNDFGLVLCHYPIPCFNHHFHNWVHLYGHVHNTFEWDLITQLKQKIQACYKAPCRMYNVGCMLKGMDYTPRTLQQILYVFEDQCGSSAQ